GYCSLLCLESIFYQINYETNYVMVVSVCGVSVCGGQTSRQQRLTRHQTRAVVRLGASADCSRSELSLCIIPISRCTSMHLLCTVPHADQATTSQHSGVRMATSSRRARLSRLSLYPRFILSVWPALFFLFAMVRAL